MLVDDQDLLVARLWRWDPERLRLDAETSLRDARAAGDEHPRPSVSTFAMRPNPGESEEDLMRRLCAYIRDVPRKSNYVTFTSLRRLENAGFDVQPSPPPHHHDVFLKQLDDNQEIERLADLLGQAPRRRFPTCETV